MTKSKKNVFFAVLSALLVGITTVACFIGLSPTKQARADVNADVGNSLLPSMERELKVGDKILGKTIRVEMCTACGGQFKFQLNDGRTFGWDDNENMYIFKGINNDRPIAMCLGYSDCKEVTSDCEHGTAYSLTYKFTEQMYFDGFEEYDYETLTLNFNEQLRVSKIKALGYKVYIDETEDVATVDNQEVFELKVGDSLVGKTLIFNDTNNLGCARITLSNGIVIADLNDLLGFEENMITMATIKGGVRGTVGADGRPDHYYDITEETYFYNDIADEYNKEKITLKLSNDIVVTELGGYGDFLPVRYFITNPVTETPGENENVNPEIPGDTNNGTETPEDTTDTKENNESFNLGKWFNGISENASKWIDENTGLAVSSSFVSGALIFGALYLIFRKRR